MKWPSVGWNLDYGCYLLLFKHGDAAYRQRERDVAVDDLVRLAADLIFQYCAVGNVGRTHEQLEAAIRAASATQSGLNSSTNTSPSISKVATQNGRLSCAAVKPAGL